MSKKTSTLKAAVCQFHLPCSCSPIVAYFVCISVEVVFRSAPHQDAFVALCLFWRNPIAIEELILTLPSQRKPALPNPVCLPFVSRKTMQTGKEPVKVSLRLAGLRPVTELARLLKNLR
jgi:hypothetical protein